MKPIKYALLALVFTSCAFLAKRADAIRVDAVIPTAQIVCERHDSYVKHDPNLTDVQESMALAESHELLDALAHPIDGEVLVDLIAPQARAVCERHDSYVSQDVILTQFAREIYMNSTKLFVHLIEQAESGQGPDGN